MTGLYVHIPFCDRKCFYCSFAIVVGQTKRSDDYLKCLRIESGLYDKPAIGSVYIGGGTPSTLTADQVYALFAGLHADFEIADTAEITVEVNPEGLTAERLSAFRENGVNRISLGIQTLRDDYLKYLGRLHDAAAARTAMTMIRTAGFNNVSCDLMISFPQQTDEELLEDQRDLLDLEPEHVSLYSLTIEAPSRFFAQKIQPPPSETQARHLNLTVEHIQGRGYTRYEVSNFARTGFASRHNIHYWQCGNYIGLGMGAHSHRDGERYWNVERFGDYVKRLAAGESPRAGSERLTREQRLIEAVLFGLRGTEGVQLAALEERFGHRLDDDRKARLEAYIKEGLLERSGAFLRATPPGMMVLDGIAAGLS
ncbi:MAG: radical SAM family heme chaperone HemW [Candidatus Omnitrophica bacterium]|nr:radical SAM family heme chaperone HemW [Candidatus Omnitrophota bacterium]